MMVNDLYVTLVYSPFEAFCLSLERFVRQVGGSG